MDKQTLALLYSALDAVRKDPAPRVDELAQKSTQGTLSQDEHEEYAGLVRLNDTLSLLKIQAARLGCGRIAS